MKRTWNVLLKYLGKDYKDVYNLRNLIYFTRRIFLPFWAFFHGSLSLITGLGSAWPPSIIHPVSPLKTSCLYKISSCISSLLATLVYEFWCFHSGVIEKSSLLGCDAALLDEFYPAFWRNTFPSSRSIQVPSSVMNIKPLKTEATFFFKISGITYQLTQKTRIFKHQCNFPNLSDPSASVF